MRPTFLFAFTSAALLLTGACQRGVAVNTPTDPPVAGYVNGFSAIDAACALVIVGCVQTVWVRLSHTLSDLKGGRE